MTIRQRFQRSLMQALSVLAVSTCLIEAVTVHAQIVTVTPGRYYSPRRISWSVYDPYYSMTSRVYAQADLIRAQWKAAASFAAAQQRNAQARSRAIANWEQAIRTEWEIRLLKEKKKLELNHARQIAKLKYLNDQKWESSRTWEKYKNHPELSSYNIRSGKALNFLLSRLAASALDYEFDENDSRYGSAALNEVTLDDELLSHVTLTQGGYEFPANREVRDKIDQWPYLLRWDDFRSERSAFDEARQQVVQESESNGDVSVKSIQKLQDAQMQLAKKFYFSSKVWDWVRQHRRYTQREDAMRFLAQLDREIKRLQETGDIRPFQGRSGYDPAADGKHLIALLTFMNRNGIEFAPAKPGSEFAYQRLFVMMRAVYLTVADEDESIKPKDLSKQIEVN
jgi:hypothetical protein